MAPIRSAMPGPLYSLDASEHKSGSRQPGWLRKTGVWGRSCAEKKALGYRGGQG